jgi:hypothetical protein
VGRALQHRALAPRAQVLVERQPLCNENLLMDELQAKHALHVLPKTDPAHDAQARLQLEALRALMEVNRGQRLAV